MLTLLSCTALIGPVAACGRDCAETAIRVWPVDVDDPDAPLTVKARLTRDGRPFSGVKIKLTVEMVGRDNAHSQALYYATTDGDGVATATRRPGVRTVPGDRVTGYAAYYQPLNNVDGTRYCWSSAGAPITCRTAGGSGPCGGGVPAPSATA